MKRFIIKTTIVIAVFAGLNLLLLIAIPGDETDYLYEYDHKLSLLDTICQPRIIFMGGSSIAFCNDSRMIRDSLGYNVINCGLHAGIGIRIPLEDGLRFIKKYDVVVFQIEYANFFNGGNGDAETLPALMNATGWRMWKELNASQWIKLLQGIPRDNLTNLVHLAKRLKKGNRDSQFPNPKFVYTKEGFNEFGDEVSHFNYPSQRYISTGKKNTKKINRSFTEWLSHTLTKYEEAGAQVIMMPPACIVSCFNESYNDAIKTALEEMHYPYIAEPFSMTLNDAYSFNTGYHLNKDGVKINTTNIIKILKNSNVINHSHRVPVK